MPTSRRERAKHRCGRWNPLQWFTLNNSPLWAVKWYVMWEGRWAYSRYLAYLLSWLSLQPQNAPLQTLISPSHHSVDTERYYPGYLSTGLYTDWWPRQLAGRKTGWQPQQIDEKQPSESFDTSMQWDEALHSSITNQIINPPCRSNQF